MNGAILALMIAAADPAAAAAPAAPVPVAPAPPIGAAPPIGPAKPPEPAAPPQPATPSGVETAQDNLDRAQQLYAQSCEDRAYASYDDLCNSLSEQVRQYRVEVERAERRSPKPTR